MTDHGVLAPNAKLRQLVVPPGPQAQEPASEAAAPAECFPQARRAQGDRFASVSRGLGEHARRVFGG